MKELSRLRPIPNHPTHHVFFLAVVLTVVLSVISISGPA